MQAPFDNIVQHLFHQPSLQSVTVDEIERMAAQHPYFAAAHFLLLKKMLDTDHPQFDTQLHKTTLYFNNPLWLQYLLQPETVSDFKISEKAPFIGADNTGDAEMPAGATAYQAKEEEVVYEKSLSTETAEPVFAAAAMPAHSGIMDVITEVFEEPAPPIPSDTHYSEVLYEPAAEATPVEESIAPENTTTVGGESETAVDTQQTEAFHFQPEDAIVQHTTEMLNYESAAPAEDTTEIFSTESHSGALDEPLAHNNEQIPEMQAGETEAVFVQHEEIMVENPEPGVLQTAVEMEGNAAASLQEHDAAIQTQEAETGNAEPVAAKYQETFATPEAAFVAAEPASGEEEADQTDQTAETSGTTAQEEKHLFRTIIETPAAKNDFLFEPYHTVDYFASQGIKLSKLESESKDKLGRQLKSFTEWLKSMKRLPQVSIEQALSANEESKVVADAIHSIENKEVITEAMAEVFEKQGLTEKAAGVYQKLSLQNPAKSAYFEAKIDLLKQ